MEINMEINKLKEQFIHMYGGAEDEIRVFHSPGRVNLIGEHTDYNGGPVFPAALTMGTTIIARKRNDGIIHMAATDLDVMVEAETNDLDKYKNINWGNYQLGVAKILQLTGRAIIGCDLLYHDTIPHGGGLSSSAAIEVATALMFTVFSNEQNGINQAVDMVEMAKISQRAENEYIGVNCGIMDQFASAMGRAGHAIYLNCQDLSYELVPVNIRGHKIVISNTNKKRSLSDSHYNQRRSECEAGLKALKKEMPHIENLAQVSEIDFEKHKDLISDEIVRKRVRHVVYECGRVKKSVACLKKNDIAEFGGLMTGSHNSLRDLYEVTGIELDTIVEEALKIEGVLGSRMTGAGFGGCSVSIVRDDAVDAFIEKVGAAYTEKIGYAPSFYISEIGDGGREIK